MAARNNTAAVCRVSSITDGDSNDKKRRNRLHRPRRNTREITLCQNRILITDSWA